MFITVNVESIIANASLDDLRDLSLAATNEILRRTKNTSLVPDEHETELFQKGDRIKAIKCYRNRTGRRLKESVDDFAKAGYVLGTPDTILRG